MTSGTQELRFRPLGRGTFVGGFFLTLLVHVGLVALAWYGQKKAQETDPGTHDILVTKMVTLGKPREKFWLPRLVQAPPPKVAEPQIKVADDPNAKPTEKPKDKDKEKPEKPDFSKKVEEVLNRRRALLQAAADEPPEGLPTGSVNGTASTASEGDAYATQIMEAVRRNWTVPTGLSVGDVINFEAEIRIAIGPDGEILRSSVHKSSGNSLYDDSCVQAVLGTRRVPPPPPAVRALYRKGIALVFGGKDLAR